MKEQELVLLLVDDEASDVELFRFALERTGFKAFVHDVNSATDAIAYLEGRGAYADRTRFPFPDLIVLDLVMRFMGGTKFLQWWREPRCVSRCR